MKETSSSIIALFHGCMHAMRPLLLSPMLALLVVFSLPFAQSSVAYAQEAEENDSASRSLPGVLAYGGGDQLRLPAFGYEAPGNTGLIPDDTPALSIHEPGEPGATDLLAQDALPSRYDARENGYVSEVRDQNPFGTCWAFATIAAMESSLLSQGHTSLSDLSERHLAYFTYHSEPDALGNTLGDYTTAVGSAFGEEMSDPYLNSGGSALVAANVLETGQGAVREDAAPYGALVNSYYLKESTDSFLANTALDSSMAYESAATIRNSRFIAMTDKSDVKRAVMEYSAAVVEVKTPDYPYFNYETNACYTGGYESSDHLVVIVGWDDDYSRANFGTADDSEGGSSGQPAHDGAWLVKNSWGSGWGDGGYYWLSYEDTVVNRSTSKAYVFQAAPPDSSRNTYQYDGSGAPAYNVVKSGGSIANVFTAKANEGGSEQLDAIAFSLSDVNVNYSIQVYTDVGSPADPTDGVPALAEPLTGTTSYEGYYTVDLPVPVRLREGARYSIVITLSHDYRPSVKYGVDATYGAFGRYSSNWKWVNFTNAVAFGQSFERDTADARWDDLAAASADSNDEPNSSARVKAFTGNVDSAEVPKPSIEDAQISLDDAGLSYQQGAVEPTVTVSYHGLTLEPDADYRLEYRDNVNAGTASVTVRGVNRFGGASARTFVIAPAPITAASVTGVKKKTYTGKRLAQSPTVILGGVTLERGKDYALSYRDNVKAGKATVVITGKGNFAGSVSRTFTIAKSANPLKVSAKSPVVKFSKKKKVVKAAKVYKFAKKGQGAVRYARVAKGSSKALSVNAKSGAVTVRKATKTGLYKLKVKVSAKGNANYKAAVRTITVKVRVR